MKTNIFSALQKDDSDDDTKKVTSKDQPKPNKKQLREEDKVKREHFGDKVEKDTPSHGQHKDYPRVKDDYKSGERRPYDRHSGTGVTAHANDAKKGGFGKGNVGTAKEEDNLREDQVEKGKEAVQPEPVEEIITLEEYQKSNNYNPDFLKPLPEVKIGDLKIEDKTVKLIQPKQKDTQEYTKKTGNNQEIARLQNNGIKIDLSEPARGRKNSGVKKNNQPIEFNDKTFPSLSE